MKVLFTSSGRRVELIEIFKREGFITFSADSDPTAPSLYIADKSFIVPRVIEKPKEYIESLIDICKKEKIDIIIPLIDPELPVLAREKESFLDVSTVVLISDYLSVEIANDKYSTTVFFEKIGLPFPKTLLLDSVIVDTQDFNNAFPAMLKPRYGSAGRGIIECPNKNWLKFFIQEGLFQNYILQKKVSGEEITIDILGDGKGNVISAVQRKRLKVRGGEVERGITIKYPELFEDMIQFSKAFKPFGAINIQCFYNRDTGERFYTEINARFGGGYPLSYYAGANFPRYIKRLLLGENLEPVVGDDYIEGLVMSRFDMAIYKKEEELLDL